MQTVLRIMEYTFLEGENVLASNERLPGDRGAAQRSVRLGGARRTGPTRSPSRLTRAVGRDGRRLGGRRAQPSGSLLQRLRRRRDGRRCGWRSGFGWGRVPDSRPVGPRVLRAPTHAAGSRVLGRVAGLLPGGRRVGPPGDARARVQPHVSIRGQLRDPVLRPRRAHDGDSDRGAVPLQIRVVLPRRM